MNNFTKSPLIWKNTIAFLLWLTCALPLQAQNSNAPDSSALPVRHLNAGIHIIQAEIAHTPAARARGLMFRQQMAPNQGMLFVFEEVGIQCFWMRNTFIPLSIAFLDDQGQIVNMEDMQPRTETNHCSQKPVRYALEMSQGWFKQKGFTAGMKISGLTN